MFAKSFAGSIFGAVPFASYRDIKRGGADHAAARPLVASENAPIQGELS
jgi:hypothetical protein